MKPFHLHAALASAWILIAMAIAVKTALLGNQQGVFAKQRGVDLKMRTDLTYQQERLRSALDWQTSAPVLQETMRRVNLLPSSTQDERRLERADLAAR